MEISKFNAWLNTATPDALERAERALDAGTWRAEKRYSEARLEKGRWHWMRRAVIQKRGTRDYVADLAANGWATNTVYSQIRDWLDSQNYTVSVESLPDEPNPRAEQIKAAIEAACQARVGRKRAGKVELENNARIPWPAMYGTRTQNEHFRNALKAEDKELALEFLWDAYEWVEHRLSKSALGCATCGFGAG
jgi:hypothetical protein